MRLKSWRSASLLLSLLVFQFSTSYADEPPTGRPTDNPPATPAQAAQLGGVATIAAKAGIKQCLTRIDQVTGFVSGEYPSGVFLFLPPNNLDGLASSYSMEIEARGDILTYATVTAAPTAEGGCNALYEAIVYWPHSCLEVAVNEFSGMKSKGPVRKDIQILEGDQSLRVFLMPAGEGCISIKKEIVY